MTNQLPEAANQSEIGQWIYDRIVELYPICRSITGNGVRETLRILNRYIPIKINEVPSGTQVFDWTVPKEWNIQDAWIKDSTGRKVVDFKESNLHLVSYSAPVHKTLAFEELRPHLFSLPDHPDWIPYRTAYYRETWGFCLTHNQFMKMTDGEYEVLIDSKFNDNGSLTYGECLIHGETEEEVLISSHICHPSLCNDNLSGVCTTAALANWLNKCPRRYTYRLVFAPGTIGAITWLARNQENVGCIRHGLILSGVGDAGALTYKRSRRNNAMIDMAMEHTLHHSAKTYAIDDFSPYGYDERQYGSPGFNLPVGRLSRTPFGTYPEYHTSADNLEFVHPHCLADTFNKLIKTIDILEHNRYCNNRLPYCEPQLGKRGLYQSIGDNEMAILWVLNLSDGTNDLLDISERASIPFDKIHEVALKLESHGLLETVIKTPGPNSP